MTYDVVRFACFRGEVPQTILISSEEYDRWCTCEPPEGYGCFETITTFAVDRVSDECLARMTEAAKADRDQDPGIGPDVTAEPA